MIVSRLDADGKLTLPSDVLEDLGLEPGSEVRFHVEDGRLVLESADIDEEERAVQAAIDEYLRDPGPTFSVEEVKTRLHARFEARARGRDAA